MRIKNLGLDNEQLYYDMDLFNYVPEEIFILDDVVGFEIAACEITTDNKWYNFCKGYQDVTFLIGKWFLPIPITPSRLAVPEEDQISNPGLITLLVTCYKYTRGKFNPDRLEKFLKRANDRIAINRPSIVEDYFEFLVPEFYDSESVPFVEGYDDISMSFEEFVKKYSFNGIRRGPIHSS